MARAIFKLKSEELAEVDAKLTGIRAVDRTFKYGIVEAYDGSGYILTIFASDKDEAHKKALWLRSKVFNDKKWYIVKE